MTDELPIVRAFAGEPRQWTAADDETAYSLPITERLTIRWFEDSACRKSWLRNPDGPEAAAVIGELVEALDGLLNYSAGDDPEGLPVFERAADVLAKVRP